MTGLTGFILVVIFFYFLNKILDINDNIESMMTIVYRSNKCNRRLQLSGEVKRMEKLKNKYLWCLSLTILCFFFLFKNL